jgi:hypothetical protein
VPFKSILRAVRLLFTTKARVTLDKADMLAVARLTSRRDWYDPDKDTPAPGPTYWDVAGRARKFEQTGKDPYLDYPQPIVTDGPDMAPPSPPWPATDDPYAKPEPCEVVPDAGLERVHKLTERGLIMPIGDKSTLGQIMDLIDRQEDAEKHLKKIGMIWERGRGWYLP